MTSRQPAAFDSLDLLFCVIPTACLGAAVCRGAAAVDWSAIAEILIMNLVSLAVGRASLTLALPVFRTAAEFVAGSLLVSLMIFAGCRLFVVSAGTAACGAVLVGIIAAVICWRRGGRTRTGWADLGVLLVVCIAAFVWSWQAIVAVPRLFATGHFDAWTDYFIHAGEITQFADFSALRGATLFAAGAPLPLYHYGSYMLTAALSGLAGILSLTAITAFWTPFGFVVLGLAACVLGGVLAGEIGGVLAVAAVLLVPSASHYGLANPFFDFHWMLQISSSGCYALACGCLSIAALILWLREPGFGALGWAIFFTLATFEFRVQVFAPLILTNAMIWAVAWRPRTAWHRPGLIAGFAGFVLIVMLALEHVQRAPHFFSGRHDPIRLLQTMHGMALSGYSGWYARLAGAAPANIGWQAGVLATGVLLLLAAAFGALLPLYVAGLLWRRHAGIRLTEDLFPLAGLIAYLAILLLFPSNPLEKLEFAHRPYVLVYTLLAIWCARFAVDFVSWPVAAGLAVALLITPLTLESKAQCSSLLWGAIDCGVAIPPGLIASAGYLRGHAAPGDVVANPADPLDEAFIALSQRPEMLPGTEFLAIQSGLSPADQAARQEAVARILAAPSGADAGAAWVITFPPIAPDRASVFTESGFAVRPAS